MFMFWKKRIIVFALGGAGCNFLADYKNNKIRIVALNSDLQDLNTSSIREKFLVGKNCCHTLGCGGNISTGMKATEENKKEIKKIIKRASKIILLAGIGGGFGIGAAYTISNLAQQLKVECTLICTTPFSFEGKIYKEADNILSNISAHIKNCYVIQNDSIAKANSNLSITEILKLGNKEVVKKMEECV